MFGKVTEGIINILEVLKLNKKVTEAVKDWRERLWYSISVDQIIEWVDDIDYFRLKIQKLPKEVKDNPIFYELKTLVENYKESLPLISDLKKESIKDRHWERVVKAINRPIPYDQEDVFVLKDLLNDQINILDFRDDIDDITDAAEK